MQEGFVRTVEANDGELVRGGVQPVGSEGIRGTIEGQLLIQKEGQSLSLHLNEP